MSKNSFIEAIANSGKIVNDALNAIEQGPKLTHNELKTFQAQYAEFVLQLKSIGAAVKRSGEAIKNLPTTELLADKQEKFKQDLQYFLNMSGQVAQAKKLLDILALTPEKAALKKGTDYSLIAPLHSFEIIQENFNKKTATNPGISGERGSIIQFTSSIRRITPKNQLLNLIGIRTANKEFRANLRKQVPNKSNSPAQNLSFLADSAEQEAEKRSSQMKEAEAFLTTHPNVAKFQRELHRQFRQYVIVGNALSEAGKKIEITTGSKAQIGVMLANTAAGFIPIVGGVLSKTATLANSHKNRARSSKYQKFASSLDKITEVAYYSKKGEHFLALNEKNKVALSFAARVTAEYQETLAQTASDENIKVLAREVLSRLRSKLPEITTQELSKESFITKAVECVKEKKEMLKSISGPLLNPIRLITHLVQGVDEILAQPSADKKITAEQLEEFINRNEKESCNPQIIDIVLNEIKKNNTNNKGVSIFNKTKM